MILHFSIKNFLSFKEKVHFSFEATKDDTHSETHVVEVAPGVRIGKLGILYGANASGKSNLLHALDWLLHFWHKKPESKADETQVVPFLLDTTSRDHPSEFSVTFYLQGQKYVYDLVISDKTVIWERLSYYPGAQPAVIFTRKHADQVSKIDFGSTIKVSRAAKDEMVVKCLPNTSFFAAYQAVNINIPQLEIITEWANNNVFPLIEPDSSISSYAEKQMLLNKDTRSFVLNFIKEADFNISNITTKKESKKVSDQFIRAVTESSNISEGEKNRLRSEKTIESLFTTFLHFVTDKEGNRSKHELPKTLQSKGTIRTMGIAGVISQAVSKNAFLVIDEIESSMHPRLVEFVIEQFFTSSKQAQLLVTTHNESLLEETDLLRNDNIWFTSKRKDGSTELYSLSDFQGLGRISSLRKAYKYGKFGATPNI